jgi:hypothetical protein
MSQNGNQAALPEGHDLPRQIGYVRRLESKTMKASQLIRKAKQNEIETGGKATAA